MSWFVRTINDNLRKHLPCAHVDECPLFAARLDGTGERGRERLAQHHTIEDWLELETGTSNQIPGNKRVGTCTHCTSLLYLFCVSWQVKPHVLQVRWADLEQRRAQARVSESYKYIFGSHTNIFISMFRWVSWGSWWVRPTGRAERTGRGRPAGLSLTPRSSPTDSTRSSTTSSQPTYSTS